MIVNIFNQARFNSKPKSQLGQFSLSKRLSKIFFFANTSTIISAFIAFTAVLAFFSIRSFVDELRAVTTVVASTSRASLAFGDRKAANRLLSSLREKGDIAYAAFTLNNGELFAELGSLPDPHLLPRTSEDPIAWTFQYLRITSPIILDGEKLGNITVVAKLQTFYSQVGLLFILGIVVTIIGGTATYFFAHSLTLSVLEPLEKLKNLAHDVSITRDFSRRLEPAREEEINELINALNYMLEQVEERDKSLLQAKERAESADRAKSNFVANVSHELRTPLHAILGMTDELLNTKLSTEQLDLLTTVRSSGDSLLSIISDILDFSKIEAGKLVLYPSSFNIREFLQLTMKMFEHSFKSKRIRSDLIIANNIPIDILADRGRLSQILVNLLGNALKFTNEGGSVYLEVKLIEDNNQLNFDKTLQFQVRDSGIGIPQDQIGIIFDSFVQASRVSTSNQGTGLGLAIVHRLTKLMGGDVSVASQEGRGTTFTFVIKVQDSNLSDLIDYNSTVQKPKSESLAGDLFNNQVILVVEDNAVNQKLAERILKNAGFNVLLAENGRECLKVVSSRQVDLILMDVNMPIMDGILATKEVRSMESLIGRVTPIVGLTAQVTSECAISCKEAGMNSLLTKPISRNELLSEIKEILSKKGVFQVKSEAKI